MLAKLRNVKLFAPFIALRDKVMKAFGLFELKSQMKKKRYARLAKKRDARRRLQVATAIHQMPSGLLTAKDDSNVVVSLTSYGKRVESSVAYAIYSILCQKQMPNRVVLNLDKIKWNNSNIPDLLRELQRVGVEINYVDDVGPHTKLIPSLKQYPDDIVITVDDDVYYDDTMVSELYAAYEMSDHKSVICREGKCILKKEGKYLPYSQQPPICEAKEDVVTMMPFGVGGVLYPPHVFSDEVFNEVVFRDKCRFADDVWFGVMEIRDNINVYYIPNNSWTGNGDVDYAEEYDEENSSALHFRNDIHGQNDIQFRALIDYYKLD